MGLDLGSIISAPFNAGAQALSSVKNLWNDYTGQTATQMSAQSAERINKMQLDWEKYKFNNAHQAEVEDLKKAGLNPILSASGSGATAGSISPQMPDYSHFKGSGGALMELGSFLANQQNTSSQLEQNYEKILSEIDLNEMLGIKANADAVNALSNAKLADKEAINATQQALKNKAQTQLINERTDQLKMMRTDLEEKIKQGRARTLLLEEEIRNAPTKAQKLYYEKELKRLQKDLFVAGKVVGTIATIGTGVLSIMKFKKVYNAGKYAIKVLSSIPKK